MHGESREKRSARPWVVGPMIEPLALGGNEAVAEMVDNVFAHSGFNARRLAQGAHLFVRMLEANATVGITLAGAMTPIGMSGVMISMIEQGFVDFIISTGANLYHDLHRPFGFPMMQGTPRVDDNALANEGIARIYDVFIADDDTLMATDAVILEACRRIDGTRPFSSAFLHNKLGEAILEAAPHAEKSLLAAAARHKVPVYTPSPGDSSIGMNLIMPHLFAEPVNLNPMLDIIETAAIVRHAERNGVVCVGGGAPKNFYMQTQPTLHQILLDNSKGGHDFFLQLTTDAPHWGGLSGATPSEARSWGKVKDAFENNVVVYSCASITFPLIAQYALVRAKPRRQRGLFSRLPELTAALKEAAGGNRRLRRQHPDLFDEG